MDLLDFVTRATEHYRTEGRVDRLQRPAIITYRATSFLAVCEALLFARTGRGHHRDRARRLLLHVDPNAYLDPRPNNALFGTPAAATAVGILRDRDALTDDELETIAAWSFPRLADVLAHQLDRTPPRLHNHAMLAMCGARLFADLLPTHPLAGILAERSEALWHDFWSVRDNLEVASLYEPYSLLSQILYADAAGLSDAFWQDAVVRNVLDRAVETVTPIGLQAAYGDGQWTASWGLWVGVFATAAARLRSGPHAWAAGAILEFAAGHGLASWPETLERQPVHSVETEQILASHYLIEIQGLAFAEMLGDGTVEPEAPGDRTTVTTRTLLERNVSVSVPERVVLRVPGSPSHLHCTLPLLHRLTGHHQYDAGAVGSLVSRDGILLGPTGYFWSDPRFHNLLLARPAEEDFLAPYADNRPPEPVAYAVEVLTDGPEGPRTVLSCERLLGYPVSHRREVRLDPDGLALRLCDRVTVHEGAFRVSPLFHTQEATRVTDSEIDARLEAIYRNLAIEIPNGPAALRIAFESAPGPVRIAEPELHPDVFGAYDVPEWIEMYRTWRVQRACIYAPVLLSAGASCRFEITLSISTSRA